MNVPKLPELVPLAHISPSVYAAARLCKARAVWSSAQRKAIPQHPSAVLGTVFHYVLERASKGSLGTKGNDAAGAARTLFDGKCEELYEGAHPLLRLKFSSPDRLPYYYFLRERAAGFAGEVHVPSSQGGSTRSAIRSESPRPAMIERSFTAPDGSVIGRPDFVDAAKGEILDYKTGRSAEDASYGVTDAELRQLRIYAYLASANGIPVSKGTIVRGDGRKQTVPITASEAGEEIRTARELLSTINDAIAADTAFEELTTPRSSNCRFCPCIPLCVRFWDAVDSSWIEEAGFHLEGPITRADESNHHGTALVSLSVTAQRGTVERGLSYIVEQIPRTWLTTDQDAIPQVGDVVRVVDARSISDADHVVRVDKASTTIWRVDQAHV